MCRFGSPFNFGGNSLERWFARWPIFVEQREVEVPDWPFDNESDLDD